MRRCSMKTLVGAALHQELHNDDMQGLYEGLSINFLRIDLFDFRIVDIEELA